MFSPNGLRASELAARLAELIETHGDCRVMVVSEGDPQDCTGVYYNANDDEYYHADTFVVH